MLVDDFSQEEWFWNAECKIEKPSVPPKVDPATGQEVWDIAYDGKCSYQYGSNGAVGMQGYTIQEAPDIYIPTTDIPIYPNYKVYIYNGWEILKTANPEKSSPNFHFGVTEIFLNHAENKMKADATRQ